MKTLGDFLYSIRTGNNYSLKDVAKDNTLTDTKIRRIEKGKIIQPSPLALRELSNFYGISIVKLFVLAGYLNNSDLEDYQKVFTGVDKLSENELVAIQEFIKLLINRSKEGEKENGI